jgi:hypothetical protein
MSGETMRFDDLPPNNRSLILAKLRLKIVSNGCYNIFDLARRRQQSMNDVWRDVCSDAEQPYCEIPRGFLSLQQPREHSLFRAKEWEPAHVVTIPATGSSAPATSSISTTGLRSSSRQISRHNRTYVLAIGIFSAALVVACCGAIGFGLFADTTAVTGTRAQETIRVIPARVDDRVQPGRSVSESVTAPPRTGTLGRMDAIKKSFSKQD